MFKMYSVLDVCTLWVDFTSKSSSVTITSRGRSSKKQLKITKNIEIDMSNAENLISAKHEVKISLLGLSCPIFSKKLASVKLDNSI